MNKFYYIVETALLLSPFIWIAASTYVSSKIFRRAAVILSPFFLLHNTLFLFDYYIKGDHFDYFIFALEYLFFCFLVVNIKKINNGLTIKVLRGIGVVFMCFGFLAGLVGTLLAIVVSQDFESNKTFTFTNNGQEYESRRYSFGFATLDDISVRFETYENFSFLPLEKKVDETTFKDTNTNFNPWGNLVFQVEDYKGVKHLKIKEDDRVKFAKELK